MKSVKTATTVLLLGILAIPQSAVALIAPSEPYGTLSGTFSVDGNGAATYIVPIELPPGTNGVAPNLSLTYNSHHGNGYVGMGWALNGISAITRCSYTVNQDSSTEFRRVGVTLTEADHFCLDGIKLVAVQGNYGENNTVYHTEKETWTKIVSYGQCGNGPCYFEAYNKDGARLDFGTTTGTTGSRILAEGSNTVRVWSIAKYTDLNGNYTQVTYTNNDQTNGEYYPSRIDYTGHNTPTLTECSQRCVQFEYESRNDAMPSWVMSPVQKFKPRND